MVNMKQLHSRTEWTLTFEVRSPIHIGSSNKKLRFVQKGKSDALKTSLLDVEVQTLEDYEKAQHLLIPGSTFKGITRSYLEQIAAQFNYPAIYSLINMLYGTTTGQKKKGRIWFSDVTVPKENTIFKSMTPIDRFTGAVKVPMTLQGIKEGSTFIVKVTTENTTAAEYGLIAFLLRAFSEALIPIGSGQSRGLGQIRLMKSMTTIHCFGQHFVTFDGIEMPKEHFNSNKELLSIKYERTAEELDMYKWMQFGVDALKVELEKEAR